MMKRIFIAILVSSLMLSSILGCSYSPLPYHSDPAVIITENRRTIEIRPALGGSSGTGLLFYPGGLVDSHVYNDLLAAFSKTAGVLSVVVKMPFNLAVFDINAGLSVIEDYPEIETWIIAGHSLGGSMAASTVKDNPSIYDGLIFMDSYPASGDSLRAWLGSVLSLFSSVEKVSDADRMTQTLSLIPPATWLSEAERLYPAERSNYSVLHQIDGGSHSYFGTYGPQAGDYDPLIEREAFHAEVIDYMVEFFTENGWI